MDMATIYFLVIGMIIGMVFGIIVGAIFTNAKWSSFLLRSLPSNVAVSLTGNCSLRTELRISFVNRIATKVSFYELDEFGSGKRTEISRDLF